MHANAAEQPDALPQSIMDDRQQLSCHTSSQLSALYNRKQPQTAAPLHKLSHQSQQQLIWQQIETTRSQYLPFITTAAVFVAAARAGQLTNWQPTTADLLL
jgi:hypothetical protein